jgi:hypothetical protein
VRVKTLTDFFELVAANANSTNEKVKEHARTLMGPRTRGSTTVVGLEDVCDPATPLANISARVPMRDMSCEYYQCKVPAQLGARLGAIPLRLALAMGHVVHCRTGEHGPELYLDQDAVRMPPVDFVTIIVGVVGEESDVFTWHPGDPLAPVKTDEGMTITDRTGVKTHRG